MSPEGTASRPSAHGPSRMQLLIVLVVALAIRIGYLVAVRDGPLGNTDTDEYESLASQIAAGAPYRSTLMGPGGFPDDLQRPPLYPAFLALMRHLTGGARTHVAFAQVLLSALLAPVLAAIVGVLAGRGAGLAAGLLYALDWVTVVHAPLNVADTLFTVLLSVAIALFVLALRSGAAGTSLAAGVLLGLAALVKPIAQAVVLAFLVAWILQRARRCGGLAFLLGYLACVGPWMARNHARHGLATLSEISSINLYLYSAQASKHPEWVLDAGGERVTSELARVNSDFSLLEMSPSERRRRLRSESWPLIRGNLPVVLRQGAVGVLRTCFGTAHLTVSSNLPRPPGRVASILLTVLPALQVLVLWVLATAGLAAGPPGGADRGVRALLAASVLLLALPTASTAGQSRFRVPMAAPLCLLAGLGASALAKRPRTSPGAPVQS